MPRAKRQKTVESTKKLETEINVDLKEELEDFEIKEKGEMKRVVSTITRKTTSKYWIGAHVSAAKGPQNAIINSNAIDGNAIALFLKNQRRWDAAPLAEQNIKEFKDHMDKYKYDYKQIVPHGSYLVNLANPDKEKRNKSYNAFLDDVKRCELLGIQLYNFHPGSTIGQCTNKESIKYLSECINKVLDETKGVTILVENMSGQKNVIGSKFEELAEIIDQVNDKSRIGVCFDTCHAFAAGYDIRTKESFNKVFDDFDKIIGIKYLKAVHLNDSKSELGSNLDRHENIGKGKIGIECFKVMMNDDRFKNIPLVLETPAPKENDDSEYKKEIKLLYSFTKDE